MLGTRKRHIETEGAQAMAVVTGVGPAKRLAAGPGVLTIDSAAAGIG